MDNPASYSPAKPLSLAIETSGKTGSVALAREECILQEQTFSHGLMHAAQMVPLIDQLLTAHGRTVEQIGRIYISHGPGSFTGLRIGITLAKTLAFATGAAITPVPTLRVLAENAPPQARHLIVVLDAKRRQVFTARYQRTDDGWTQMQGAHLDSLEHILANSPRPIHVLGEGLPYHQSAIPDGDDSIIVTTPDLWQARASVVARLGWVLADQGHFADPDSLQPLYIRPPEAQEKWDREHG